MEISRHEQIKEILMKYEETRENDKLLWLAFMVIHSDLKSVFDEETYQKFKEVIMRSSSPTFEELKRIRRFLQNDIEVKECQPTIIAISKDRKNKNAKEISKYFTKIMEELK